MWRSKTVPPSSSTVVRLESLDNKTMEPIAIVGMAIRFPREIDSLEAFWDMLVAGRSAWSKIPDDRFNVDAFYHPNPDRIDAVCRHISPD